MKAPKNLLVNLLLGYSALFLLGCYGTTRVSFDKEKVFKQKAYQTQMPFTMAGGKNNIAGVNNKDQGRLAVDFDNGFNSSFSFSPKKNLLFMVNYTIGKFSNRYHENLKGPFTVYTDYTDDWGSTTTDSTVYQTMSSDVTHALKQSYFDVASGYYKNVRKKGTLEMIGGISYGKSSNNYNYTVSSYSTEFIEERKFIRIYVQPALCYNNKSIEVAVITKFSLYNFLSQQFTYEYKPQLYEMQRFAATAEPSLHLGLGKKMLIFYVDFGWGITLYQTDVKWQHSNINVGMNLRLGKNRVW